MSESSDDFQRPNQLLLNQELSKAANTSTEHVHVRFRTPVKKREVSTFWNDNRNSRDFVWRLFTCFYALFIVVFGIVIELANLIYHGHQATADIRDLILSVYLFGGSIVFIGVSSVLVLRHHLEVMNQRKSIMMLNLPDQEPSVLTNVSTGSLYLRIGCVVFGIIGVVYYGMKTLVCGLGWQGTESECNGISITISVLAALFIFVQMWFVFCNGKITFIGWPNLARFGLMHLVTTNLWMWLRYILYEEAKTVHEIQNASFKATSSSVNTTHSATEVSHHFRSHEEECSGSDCVFGEYSEFMYTCVVEYSLICAGVAFVFWTSISVRQEEVQKKLRKRNIISMDCSRTSEGLFGGFFVIIICIISIALFNAYSAQKELSQWIFLGTNALFFLLSILITLLAFYRMRVLQFIDKKEDTEESAELLDQILLVVGLVGELVYCIGGIIAFFNNDDREPLSYLLVVVHFLRLVQVSFQSFLILISSRLVLSTTDEHILRYKPGKQVITLMLMLNCALFLLNIFEAQKAGVTDEIVALYGNRSWALLVRGCSPLTIFYRFHSSACFADVWKKTFKVKKGGPEEEETDEEEEEIKEINGSH